MTRYIAFGDVHGMIDELKALIAMIPIQEEDVLVFLGDYVDRGTDSKAVLDYLMELQLTFPKTVFLRGNHEDMFLRRKTSMAHLRIWLANGGLKCLQDFGTEDMAAIPQAYDIWLGNTHLFYQPQGSNLLFVHAGINPNFPLGEQSEQDLMWIREVFFQSDKDYPFLVVHGHTPTMGGVEILKNRINVDGGSCFGGYLNCVVLTPEGEAVQMFSQKCRKLW